MQTTNNAPELDIDLQRIKETAPNVFDCQTYDTVLKLCRIFFGPGNVTYTESSITIKDRINLHLSLSWNETKIYIDTFIGKIEPDAYIKWNRQNYTFRLFGLNQIFEYLKLKHIENEFIRENEG